MKALPVTDLRTGQTAMERISDFQKNGWEIIRGDAYTLFHPSTGAVETAITPLDVALFASPFKGASSAGKVVGSGGDDAASLIGGSNLAKSLASEEQMAQTGTVIAGAGSSTTFRDAAKKAAEYGGNAVDYVKMSSSSYTSPVKSPIHGMHKFETHWVENLKTGSRYEFKTKFKILDD